MSIKLTRDIAELQGHVADLRSEIQALKEQVAEMQEVNRNTVPGGERRGRPRKNARAN